MGFFPPFCPEYSIWCLSHKGKFKSQRGAGGAGTDVLEPPPRMSQPSPPPPPVLREVPASLPIRDLSVSWACDFALLLGADALRAPFPGREGAGCSRRRGGGYTGAPSSRRGDLPHS